MRAICTIALFFYSFICWSQEAKKDELPNNKEKFKIQKQNPLMILDGFEMKDSTRLSTIDPNSIESMEVLNEKQGYERYGSKGAQGAVLITSKSGVRIRLNPALQTQSGLAPLYILDDAELKGTNALGQIKPNDIEKIEVIKDQQALDIYGEKGKNGVVLITTKNAYKNKF